MKKLQRNIYKLYAIQAVTAFLVFVPVLVLFFQQYGLTMSQIMLLQATFSVTMVVFQIPTGYVADLIGRKKSIIIGVILAPLTYMIYSVADSFTGFFIAEIALGLSASFISGADSAMIYDTLAQLKREKEYKKTEGKYISVWGFSEATASILGGFLAVISFRLPFFVMVAVSLIAIPIALSLVEPMVHREKEHREKTGRIKDVLSIIKYSIHEHKEIKWLIIYSAVIWAALFNMVWFTQEYEKIIGLPLPFFGVVWASFLAFFSISSLFSYKYEEKLGRKYSLISLIIITILGYFLVAYTRSLWGIGIIYLFYFVRGVNAPIFKDYINKLTPSNIRATVMSVQGMAGRLMFSLTGPFAGWLADAYSFTTAIIISGSVLLFLGILSLYFLHLNNALDFSNGENLL